MKVTKAAGVELSGAPSEEQLEKINRPTEDEGYGGGCVCVFRAAVRRSG